MAITYSIPIGPVSTLLSGVVYALPGKKVTIYAQGAPTLVQSNTVDMAVTSAVTLTGNQAEVAGAFIKSTAGDAVVRVVGD